MNDEVAKFTTEFESLAAIIEKLKPLDLQTRTRMLAFLFAWSTDPKNFHTDESSN